jgi:integrase
VSPRLIDDEMAQGYAARRARAAATIRYELGMLSVALRWARDKKLIQEAPAIWRPMPPERRERHVTREQFRRFLAAVVAPHARLYMVLAIATCARPTAILELTWDRVDFDRGLIDLNPPGRTQTAKRRPVVPIADYALAPLQEAYATGSRTMSSSAAARGSPASRRRSARPAKGAMCTRPRTRSATPAPSGAPRTASRWPKSRS